MLKIIVIKLCYTIYLTPLHNQASLRFDFYDTGKNVEELEATSSYWILVDRSTWKNNHFYTCWWIFLESKRCDAFRGLFYFKTDSKVCTCWFPMKITSEISVISFWQVLFILATIISLSEIFFVEIHFQIFIALKKSLTLLTVSFPATVSNYGNRRLLTRNFSTFVFDSINEKRRMRLAKTSWNALSDFQRM